MEIIYISLDKIFPPNPETKVLSNNSFGQVLVPVVDEETNIQTGDGFCINRKQLLSVTYLSEIRVGEYEAIYTLVQQAMLYYLYPCVSPSELQVALTKTDEGEEHIDFDDILYFDDDLNLILSEEEDDDTSNNENHGSEALPLSKQQSVAPPSNPTTIVMQNSKGWRAPRPYVMRKKKNSSVAEKVARLENVDWLRNWKIEPRQRKNGRYDYFYHHKRVNLVCRSMVEVHCFHSYGIFPPRPIPRRRLQRPIQRPVLRPIIQRPEIQDDASTVNANEAESEPVMEKKKRTLNEYSSGSNSQSVSEMLKEAYDNLLIMSSSSSASTFGQTSATDHDDGQPPMSVEEFLRDSYDNLNNTPPPHPNSSQSTQLDNKYVEDFLRDSYNNLLNTTPMPKSTRRYKKRKVAEKSTEEKTGGTQDGVIIFE